MNKIKIFNDPVYGFVRIPLDILYKIIEHPYFQRLRRIKQLGLTHMVYPGALHTRFHHALGALHLLQETFENFKLKGIIVTDEEAEATSLAVLLHDIGHGPFSHTLEFSLVKGIAHEELSLLFMKKLNDEFEGKLELAIKIFENKYHKKFLHQLVSSQLDVDRLDYLRRDSFYTGVSEGVIGSDRIIKMMTVENNELVIESKGIYSIEKFLVARRLMYWQVYLHKTVVSAEYLAVKILERAKHLANNNIKLNCTPALSFFLYQNVKAKEFFTNSKVLDTFAKLDDHDIMAAIKEWEYHKDKVLSSLCSRLLNRDLFKIEVSGKPFNEKTVNSYRDKCMKKLQLTGEEAAYFVFSEIIENSAYKPDGKIKILYKNGDLIDIAKASDQYNITALSKPVQKYFLCFPKQIMD